MLIISVALSLTCACFGTAATISGWADAFLFSAAPLAGFLVYDLIYAALGAALDRRSPASWPNDFARHLRFSVPLLFLCAVANFALALGLVVSGAATGYQAFILMFLVDYLLIAAYWALRSLQHARMRENRKLGETVSERYKRSSATAVSVNVALVILSAALFMISNAGLKAAGVEFSHLQR
jgi:hypothetical protein